MSLRGLYWVLATAIGCLPWKLRRKILQLDINHTRLMKITIKLLLKLLQQLPEMPDLKRSLVLFWFPQDIYLVFEKVFFLYSRWRFLKPAVKRLIFNWSESIKSLKALTVWHAEPSEKPINHCFWPIELSSFYGLTDLCVQLMDFPHPQQAHVDVM